MPCLNETARDSFIRGLAACIRDEGDSLSDIVHRLKIELSRPDDPGRAIFPVPHEERHQQGRLRELIDNNWALRLDESVLKRMARRERAVIWMGNTDMLCTFVNQAWQDLCGRKSQDGLGDGWSINVHPEDIDACFDSYRSAFNARRPYHLKFRIRRADGKYIWIIDHGIPRFSSGGTFEGYIGTTHVLAECAMPEVA